ncbi:MAG: TlpA disulfide reductase family protein [Flavobacterium sp.]
MKKLLFLIPVLIVSVILLSLSHNSSDTKFKKEALDTKLMSFDGSEVAFKNIVEKHKGKTLVIEIWASWCGDCVKNMPNVKELQDNNPNTDFVFLSCDKTDAAWKAGIEKHQINGDHYLIPDGMKGDFGKALDLNWIPRYIVVDKKGKIALYKAIETDHEQVKSLLKSL